VKRFSKLKWQGIAGVCQEKFWITRKMESTHCRKSAANFSRSLETTATGPFAHGQQIVAAQERPLSVQSV
jgi:hypothetical protein